MRRTTRPTVTRQRYDFAEDAPQRWRRHNNQPNTTAPSAASFPNPDPDPRSLIYGFTIAFDLIAVGFADLWATSPPSAFAMM
jgi:hypothetical protein